MPIWCHPRHEGPVIWDYHVLAVGCKPTGDIVVFDQDSTLPFPCSVDVWIDKALQPHSAGCRSEQLRRRWRCVEATAFLAHFASDRSHMVKQVDVDGDVRKQWSSPPPAYQCISTEADDNTLPMYMDMSSSDVLSQAPRSLSVCRKKPFGVLLEEREFLQLLQPCGS